MTFVIASDGVAVAVHELGGTGAALLMVHAAGLHGLVLAPLSRHLTGAFHCVALDCRGHGDSVLPPGHELDWYGLAADVLAVVDGLALRHPYGFGHSSGATAVLMAEQARPGTFGAIYCYEPVLVAADPPLGRDDDSVLAARARRRHVSFTSKDEARRHFASKPPLAGVHPDVLTAYVDHGFTAVGDGEVRLKCEPEHEAVVYETATAHDAWGRLADVACPVAVACGSESEGCPPSLARSHVERLPLGRIEVLDGLGHLGPLERPEQVASSMAAFFAGSV
jgi:pimeloyl-ACP methyl ester carboxylesterase